MSHIGQPPCDAGAILHGTPAVPHSAAAARWTLVAAILGSSMAFIDGTVVNVALPAIQRELNATASEAQWVIESYALFLAALLLVGGSLGDHFGRRRIFMIGVALFTLASIGCGLSTSVAALIAARSVQGVGAALLVPGSLSLLSAAFPQAERGAAIGTWSAFSGITAAIGPVIGGYLVDHYAWTWAFLVNAPIGALLLAICAREVPESLGSASRDPVDVAGAILATVGLAGAVFALIEAPTRGWGAAGVLVAGAIGVLGLGTFVVWERHARAPMLPLQLFQQRDFAGANLLTLLLYGALGGGLFFVPLNLIQVQGYGATAAGAALLPFIAIMFALSTWAGTLVERYGSKLPLVVGPTIAGAGFALFAAPSIDSNYWTTFFPAVCVLGLGMSITVAPLTTTVMNAVDPALAGTASGINNALSRAAGLLAIAIFGVVLAWAFNASLVREIRRVDAPPQAISTIMTQRQKLAGAEVPEGLPEEVNAQLKHAIGHSFVTGFRWVMLLSAVLALLSAVSAWFLISGKQKSTDSNGSRQ
ncbi:MAG TPA: MFS transporter [Burkholderiaceae bacterium]|nr:MFS transporter [Burkholderiaceae bacterium]